MHVLRFARNVFEREYKATIGVDFDVERIVVLDIPFKIQMFAPPPPPPPLDHDSRPPPPPSPILLSPK